MPVMHVERSIFAVGSARRAILVYVAGCGSGVVLYHQGASMKKRMIVWNGWENWE
jgi:hypothetical protein